MELTFEHLLIACGRAALTCIFSITLGIATVYATENAPANWITVNAGDALSLLAPAGTIFVRAKSADSLTGTFKGPGFALEIDYGLFSDPLSKLDGMTRVETSDVSIDGKAARMVSGVPAHQQHPERYFFGLHVPDAAQTAVGKLKLTATAAALDRTRLDLIQRMVKTIRFNAAR